MVLFTGSQEHLVLLKATTKDGQSLVGDPSITSVQVESGLGLSELKLKDLRTIRFEGEGVVVTGLDGSSLKGKLKPAEFKIKSPLGELTFQQGALKELAVQHVFARNPQPWSGQEKGQVVFAVQTIDGNNLIGTLDLAKVSIESTLGKFEVDIRWVSSFGRNKEPHPHALNLRDGSELRGPVKFTEFKIRTGLGEYVIKPDSVLTLHYRDTRYPDPPGPNPKGPAQGPGAPPPPPKKVSVPPTAMAEVNAPLGVMRLTKDGKKLYVVNLKEKKLSRWKLPSLELEASAALAGDEKSVALVPTGTKVCAVGQKSVTLLSADTLATLSSFSVELAMEDVHAFSDEYLFVTGFQGTALVSTSKTAVIQRFAGGGNRIESSPSGDRLYVADAVYPIVRNSDGSLQIGRFRPRHGMGHGFSTMTVSPDGRYGCSFGDSRIFRLGRCWSAAVVLHAQVEMHGIPVFSPDNRRLYLFTGEGFLKVYDTLDFQLTGSHYIGVRVTQALVDPDGKSLTVAAIPEMGSVLPQRRPQWGPESSINLYRFEIPK